MKNKGLLLLMAMIVIALVYACSASKIGSTAKDESLNMKIKEQRNVIDPHKLPYQQPLSLGDRALVERGESRGLLSPVAGSLVSIASNAVKSIIANRQKKYIAGYQFGLTDLYFYDQLSNESPFDPVGMQFSGFKIIRTFVDKTGNTDTALVGDFAVDTTRISELINNSVFRLRVRNFELRYAKARIENGKEKKLNLDFEITFTTSYVNDQGTLFDSVVLGKFYLFLRDAPLDKEKPGYKDYYERMKDSLLTGKSFIVPRSFGYHREPDGQMKPGYSQGAYSIQVKVKESSKNHFVTQLIFENANMMIDAGSSHLKSTLGKKL